MYELVGLTAAFLTTAAFIPQAIRIIKTKSTGDISFVMYLMFTVGIATWLTYGILISSFPIIIANAVAIPFAAAILFMKVKFR